ncbi:hypothetical protein NDU88_007947 [Pleurodeles waltl]|uniref:Uncharacterized protein n=1 Tax=Pleurodeles waltl TaxID=8319 RepID=A0AAV7NXY8_PLEWA|nr:hypothetical protein NDU88_007947 [Pleurodeles waltl]
MSGSGPIGSRPGRGPRVRPFLRDGHRSCRQMTATLESSPQLLLGFPGGKENGARPRGALKKPQGCMPLRGETSVGCQLAKKP